MKDGQSVTTGQAAIMTLMAFLPFGLFVFPADMERVAGRSGLYSLVLLGALAIGGVWVTTVLAARFPDKTVIEYLPDVYGAFLGKAVGLLLIPIHLYLTGILLRVMADLMREIVFDRTPVAAILFFMLFAATYLGWLGLTAIARLLARISLTVLFLFLVMLVASSAQIDLRDFGPTLEASVLEIIRGAFVIAYVFLGVQIPLMLGPFVKEQRHWLRSGVAAVCVGLLFLSAIYLVTTGVLGSEGTADMIWPVVQVLQLAQLRGLIIERLGLFIVIVWTTIALSAVVVQLWAIGYAAVQWADFQPYYYRYYLLPAALAMYVAAGYPVNIQEIITVHLANLAVLGVTMFLAFPLVTLIVASVGGRKGGHGRNPPTADSRERGRRRRGRSVSRPRWSERQSRVIPAWYVTLGQASLFSVAAVVEVVRDGLFEIAAVTWVALRLLWLGTTLVLMFYRLEFDWKPPERRVEGRP